MSGGEVNWANDEVETAFLRSRSREVLATVERLRQAAIRNDRPSLQMAIGTVAATHFGGMGKYDDAVAATKPVIDVDALPYAPARDRPRRRGGDRAQPRALGPNRRDGGPVRVLGRTRLPVMIHPEFWSRRRISFPGLQPAEIPSTSRPALQEMGFAIVEKRQRSFLLDGAVLITGEVDRSTAFATGRSSLARGRLELRPGFGEKQVAHEERADTCLRARAGIRADGACVAACVRKERRGAARKRCPSRLLRAKSGSVDGRIRPGESVQFAWNRARAERA